MIIYQEYSDIVNGKNVGRFKNAIEETMFIHYWQDRIVPIALSSMLDTYTILQNIYTSNDIPIAHINFLKMLGNNYTPLVIYDIGSCVLHWTQHAHQVWNDSEIYLFGSNGRV